MTFRRAAARWLVMLLVPCATTRAQVNWRMTLGAEQRVDIGKIHNAPNGHISYIPSSNGLTLWVDGRVYGDTGKKSRANSTQGTFMLHAPDWSIEALQSAASTNVFHAVHDPTLACTAPNAWFRDYAAINTIIPSARPGELLAFVDGEFHPLHTGNPLRASIGIATSTDGGVHWSNERVIVQGNDMTKFSCAHVDSTMTRRADNEGAAGPTAVIRTDSASNATFIYLYYLDRVRLTVKSPTSDIYVARAPYTGGGAPGTWQFWTGQRWSNSPTEVIAQPVVTTPAGGGEAAHPHVTYNTTLQRWLMVFHTGHDLYATSSSDGVHWDQPRALGTPTAKAGAPAFPTLVTPNLDQGQTAGTGLLFYSRKEAGTRDSTTFNYVGYVRSFTVIPQKCLTPMECCKANGGTFSGGRCS